MSVESQIKSEEIIEREIKSTLNSIFPKETIAYLKANKEHITSELLDELRSFGNPGKELALDILDLKKNTDNYYLDSFGNRISYSGNRRLKKQFIKIDIHPIHVEEIEKCVNDVHYFKDNYIKIRTKSGVNFPELRKYQNDFITLLDSDSESIVGLMGRQSGKSVSTGIYLAWLYLFDKDKNIGIVANKGAMAREFLSNVKNMLLEIPMWMQQGTLIWNKSSIENESGMRILTDVPSENSFRGYSVHCLVIDENAFIRPNIWEAFSDSIFPSQSSLAWKKNISISTANGMNFFYDIVRQARNGTNGTDIFEVDWRDVPRFDKDGNIIPNEIFKENIIKKHGTVYFEQNYGNSFVGSSHTFISADKLKLMDSKKPILYKDGLEIYDEPIERHKYIMSVDPAKDGSDAFSVQVIDTQNMNFIQVASAELNIDYLQMPEFLIEWAKYYNNAFLIIENNEGAGQSVADFIYKIYEYDNIYFDRDQKGKRKKFPGFRTTVKTRKQILQNMKLFIENNMLKINGNSTLSELYRFILVNGKYQAEEGYHDDMVMSLAIAFAPFCDAKNFEDIKLLLDTIYNKDENEDDEVDIDDIIILGDLYDSPDEELHSSNSNRFILEPDGFY